MVPRTGNHAQFQGLHEVNRHLVSGLHPRRNAQQPPDFPRQALLGPVESHPGRARLTIAGGLGLHSQREGAQLLAVAAVQAEGPVEQALPAGRCQGTRLAGQNAHLQPLQADIR